MKDITGKKPGVDSVIMDSSDCRQIKMKSETSKPTDTVVVFVL